MKIAEDQKLMQGVGRVVWKREPREAGDERPAGMGVKFIKIDESSKRLIDQLVSTRGDGKSAYDVGSDDASITKTASQQPPAPAPAPVAAAVAAIPAGASGTATPLRKATMIGLGAMGTGASAQPPRPTPPPPDVKPEDFFPKTESEKEMPPPEDRTMMKQAAELLQDALREAGGSMEEVGVDAKPEPKLESKPEDISATPTPVMESPVAKRGWHEEVQAREESKHEEPKHVEAPAKKKAEPAPERKAPASGRERREQARPADSGRSRESVRPAVSALAAEAQQESGGGGKAIALLLGVAAAAALVFFLTRQKPSEPEVPLEPTPQVNTEPAPTPTPTPSPPPAPAATEPPPVPSRCGRGIGRARETGEARAHGETHSAESGSHGARDRSRLDPKPNRSSRSPRRSRHPKRNRRPNRNRHPNRSRRRNRSPRAPNRNRSPPSRWIATIRTEPSQSIALAELALHTRAARHAVRCRAITRSERGAQPATESMPRGVS